MAATPPFDVQPTDDREVEKLRKENEGLRAYIEELETFLVARMSDQQRLLGDFLSYLRRPKKRR